MAKSAPAPQAATLTVKRIPLSKCRPHPRNPRTHPDPGTPAWKALAASLAHDYYDPIVYNKRNGLLVSGHLRVKVLRAQGITAADAVIVDYDEPTHLARMLAANRLQGEDDRPALKDLLEELDTGAFDMDLTGFDQASLEDLMVRVPVFEPVGENEQARLDQKTPITCPKCGHEFTM